MLDDVIEYVKSAPDKEYVDSGLNDEQLEKIKSIIVNKDKILKKIR